MSDTGERRPGPYGPGWSASDSTMPGQSPRQQVRSVRGLRILLFMCIGLLTVFALSLAYELATGQAQWVQGIQIGGHAMVTAAVAVLYRQRRSEKGDEGS